MIPAPDDTARAMGLHEAARRAGGLLRRRAAWCRETAQENGQGPFTAALTQDAAEHEAAADALEAALQPAAGDEERALRLARAAYVGESPDESGVICRTRDIMAAFAAVRAEAAATERARLADALDAERCKLRSRPGDDDRTRLIMCGRDDGLLIALSALAADTPCPARGATEERECRGLEVGADA